MARNITVYDDEEMGKLKWSSEGRSDFEFWLYNELEDAWASKKSMESLWLELLRQYDGVPKNPVKSYPIENAPNIEVTLGAIATDSIFAQAMDLKWNQISPLLTVRPIGNNQSDQDDVKAFQRFANWIVSSKDTGAHSADEMATLDTIQLGTGVFYVPWGERTIKNKVARVESFGPTIHCHPPEDFLVPGGSYGDLEQETWVALRFWYTKDELIEFAKRNGFSPEGAESYPTRGWVRNRRESLSRNITAPRALSDLYDIYVIFAYYDIDGCGTREDLRVIWNHTGRKLLHVGYNPCDRRPVSAQRYQIRSHVFWGIGVMEMMRPYEEEVSEIHNERTANMIVTNCRHWIGKEGSVPANMRMRPNKVTLVTDPKSDLVAAQMADVYPSSSQAEMMTMMLAERRVGVNEMSMPRPSSIMGSRTPGITALSLLQQVNRRFTPAFDAMRFGLSGAVIQCLFRYQEKILAGDLKVEAFIRRVFGQEDGERIIKILGDKDFDNAFSVELSASNVSVNREADRQNAVMLVNVLTQYYERALQLMTISSNPQTPPQVAKVAVQIAEKAGEIIARTISTFDQMRDPATFIVDFGEEIDQVQGLDPEGMAGLTQMMSAAQGGMEEDNFLPPIEQEPEPPPG